MDTALPPRSHSLWLRDQSAAHAPLDGDRTADVAIVGGGIAGLTTGVLLARAGLKVVVLEGDVIGAGTTGHTTAKISALQGTIYRTLRSSQGADGARRYATAQHAGREWIADYVSERSVECAFERRPAVTYTTEADNVAKVREEADAAGEAGLAATFTDDLAEDLRLPFPVTGAVVVDDQAQFDPYPYLGALAAEIAGTPGCSVHERSRVTKVHSGGRPRVDAAGGTVRADTIVVTTLMPVVHQGLLYARAEPLRSYCLAVTVDGPLPRGMYLSADTPTRSLRTARHDGGEVAVVGGGGHVVGRRIPTTPEYETLRDWATGHFPVTGVLDRWSAQDYESVDHLPYVGPASPGSSRVLVATGFAKWGMTNGTAAALALADRILDRPDGPAAEWSALLDPKRLSPRGAVSAARLNAGVAVHLAGGWLSPGGDEEGEHPARRSRRGLRPTGTAEVDGEQVTVSLVCTHLGGICSWNDAETSWDCPLHGSRFAASGEVVTAPAVTGLDRLN